MIIIHILKADIFWSMGMVLDFLKCGCGGHRNFVSMWHNLGHSFIHLVLFERVASVLDGDSLKDVYI